MLFLIVKLLYMSNIKRHPRKRKLKTNLVLCATNREILPYKLSKYPRYGVRLCIFGSLNLILQTGFTDMLRLSLEKLMQICFSLKTGSYEFSLALAQRGVCQNSRHTETPLCYVLHLTLTFLSPSHQPLPPSHHIPFISSTSLEIALSWLLS